MIPSFDNWFRLHGSAYGLLPVFGQDQTPLAGFPKEHPVDDSFFDDLIDLALEVPNGLDSFHWADFSNGCDYKFTVFITLCLAFQFLSFTSTWNPLASISSWTAPAIAPGQQWQTAGLSDHIPHQKRIDKAEKSLCPSSRLIGRS